MPRQPFDLAPEITAVLDHLRRIVRALRESSRAAQSDLGLSGAQLFVLRSLAGSRASSVNELAACTRTHQSTVSVVVKRLVERGLVRRSTSTLDARRVELELTSRGRAMLARAPLCAQDELIAGIERMQARERRLLATLLHRLVAAMQLADDPPAMFFEDEEKAGLRGAAG